MTERNEELDELLSELRMLEDAELPRDVSEAAISLATRALDLVTRADDPEVWADVQASLGRYQIVQGYEQNEIPLISEGIEHTRSAHSVWTRTGHTAQWAAAQGVVADGRMALGELKEDATLLRTAIGDFALAGEEIRRESDPQAWAKHMNATANAHFRLAQMTGDTDALSHAVTFYEKALEVWRRDEDESAWSIPTFNIGLCLKILGDLKGDASAYEQSITAMIDSLAGTTEGTVSWGSTMNSIASSRMSLGSLTASPAHMEEAHRNYEAAIAVFPRETEPAWWAMLSMNIVTSFDRLGNLRSDPTLLRQGIEYASDAATTATRERMPNFWAGLMSISAHSRLSLARLLGDARPLRRTIDDITSVIEVRSRESVPMEWAYLMRFRGTAALEIARSERSVKWVGSAIDDLVQALTVFRLDNAPYLWAQTSIELAGAYALLGILSADAGRLRAAVVTYGEIVDVLDANTAVIDLARSRLGRGEALLAQARLTGSHSALGEAIDDFSNVAGDTSAAVDPERYLRARRGSAAAHLLLGDFVEAADTATAVLGDAERLLLAAPADHERAGLIKALTGTGDVAAYAHAHLGNVEAALAALERGRAFQLRSRLNEAEADLDPETAKRVEVARIALTQARRGHRAALEAEGGEVTARKLASQIVKLHGEFTALLEEADIAEIAAPATVADVRAAFAHETSGALVSFVVTDAGGVAIVITKAQEPELLWLPELTSQQLDGVLWTPEQTGWLDAYDRFRASLAETQGFGAGHGLVEWNGAVETACARMWALCMAPLDACLIELGLTGEHPVTIVPNGRMSALPLHVAGTEDECFMDRWAVSMVPGVAAFIAAQARSRETERTGRSLFAVTDPNGDLDMPQNPATACFPNHEVRELNGHAASRDAVLASLPDSSYASFFTHAWWDPDRPDRSWIQLAGDDRVEARDFADLDLSRCRMIALGACESGVPGQKQTPDEFEGLPTSLLQAGAPGVLATLWPVFNHSSAALLRHFFRDHVLADQTPAVALRHAQSQLRHGAREATNDMDLPRAAFSAPDNTPGQPKPLGLRPTGDAQQADMRLFDPSRRMFWAAFVYFGA